MKITDKEIKCNNVKSAADLLSTEDMTAEQVKDIFDKLPELIAKKHNKLVDYVNEAVRSPESAQFDIQLFTNPAQFGTSYDAPMANIFAAMPKNSLALLNPSKCTDESWNLPYTNGVLEIKKSETRGKIVLWTRLGTSGDWSAVFDNSNRPTGVWTKYINSNDLEDVMRSISYNAEKIDDVQQQVYDSTNKANEAKAAVDSLEADLGIISTTNLERVSAENDKITLAGSVKLEEGNYIVQFGGYFAANENGYRRIYLSTNANPTTSTPARQRQVLHNAAGGGRATYMTCTTCIAASASTTLSVCVQHNAGTALNFDGYIQTIQLTGNTAVLPDLEGGGSGGIFG